MDSLAPICALLWADAGFKAASPGGIMEIFLAENATLPATTCQIVGSQSEPNLSTSGPQKVRIQFDCHASSAQGAAAARTALRMKLNGFQGMLSDGTFLQNATIIGTRDSFDYGPRKYRRVIEFYLYFNFQQ